MQRCCFIIHRLQRCSNPNFLPQIHELFFFNCKLVVKKILILQKKYGTFLSMLSYNLFPMKYFFFSILFFVTANVFSQDIIIVGQVFSLEEKMPIEGAEVWFSGTKIRTQTNDEGYFFLQSETPQNSVVVSMAGYKKREVKLDKSRRDQMLEIWLKEDINLLDELIVFPDKTKITRILKNFHNNRTKNNPENFSGFDIENQIITRLYLSNLRQKWLQKKLFHELQAGVLQENDSTLIFPVHFSQKELLEKYFEEKTEKIVNFSEENSVQLFEKQQLELILQAYISQPNFYKNSISLFGKSFVSPMSKQGNLYYDYFLVDSVLVENSKIYEIRYRPKNTKNLTFKGTFWLDAESFALKKIEATLPQTANLNYVNNLIFFQNFEKIDTTKYFYSSVNQTVGFNYNFTFDKNKNFVEAILDRKSKYGKASLHSDTVVMKEAENYGVVSEENRQFSSAIDSLNNTKLLKVAYTLVDIFMNGYVHVGKFDLGPVFGFLRYNALEGFRPTFSARTGRKMSENFTAGGYFGYGFKDKKIKYGGEIQTCFGKENRHLIGIFYDNDVVRFGYGDALLLNENMVGKENILTSFSWGKGYNKLIHKYQASLKYAFEQRGFRFSFDAKAAQLNSNRLVYFEQQDRHIDRINVISATANFRFSFKENSLQNFFHRYYLNTKYPIVNFQAEYGYWNLTDFADFKKLENPFLKLKFTVKQTITFPLGKFLYSATGAKIIGKIPLPLLETPLSIQGLWYNSHNFNLVRQMDFLADSYVAANLRYYSNGLIFNNIPYIKVLNLRETAFVNFAWGKLDSKHSSVLNLPPTNDLKVPYVEIGVGITNILRFLSVESVWRVTHRNAPNAQKWGINAKIYFDF